MRKTRYTADQMLAAVRMAEAGTPVADVCREVGISHHTYYGWKKRFAGTTLTESRRLKELEKENSRLKKLVAELTQDRHALQETSKKSCKASGEASAGRVSTNGFSPFCEASMQAG